MATLVPVKGSGFLTEGNKDGSDMVVTGPSSTDGGMDTMTVTEGETVIDIVVDGGTGAVSVILWLVHDGDPWEELATLNTGDIIYVTGTEIEYQKGLAAVILDDGTIGTLNLPIMFEVAGV